MFTNEKVVEMVILLVLIDITYNVERMSLVEASISIRTLFLMDLFVM